MESKKILNEERSFLVFSYMEGGAEKRLELPSDKATDVPEVAYKFLTSTSKDKTPDAIRFQKLLDKEKGGLKLVSNKPVSTGSEKADGSEAQKIITEAKAKADQLIKDAETEIANKKEVLKTEVSVEIENALNIALNPLTEQLEEMKTLVEGLVSKIEDKDFFKPVLDEMKPSSNQAKEPEPKKK